MLRERTADCYIRLAPFRRLRNPYGKTSRIIWLYTRFMGIRPGLNLKDHGISA
jgi:hypothetical protein